MQSTSMEAFKKLLEKSKKCHSFVAKMVFSLKFNVLGGLFEP